MKIHIIPILSDNYAYLLEAENGEAAIVDPGEAGPVIEEIQRRGLNLTHILNTHHHGDHIAGNQELKNKYGAKIAGPVAEEARISGLDIKLREGGNFSFAGEKAEIYETPGHTRGHICFYFPGLKAVFTGDTLFSMGCGRLFEGTADQMWDSFRKLTSLPGDTKVYCGHEYTKTNGEFCLRVEPDNPDLKHRMAQVTALRQAGKPTLPSTVELEKKTNVFLRAGSAQKFAELRKLKDAA